MNKEEKIAAFDPSSLAEGNQLFGLPFTEEESDIVILPVPWEVTVSYNAGTAKAPAAILAASRQVDLYDVDVHGAWKHGIYLKKVNKQIARWSKELRTKAENYLSLLEDGVDPASDKSLKKMQEQINLGGTGLKDWVQEEIRAILHKGKLPGLLGGDHSTPLGFLLALEEVYPSFGILQIDAHCDLRKAYEGFTYSHASIMYNALQVRAVDKLVQVGIRDYCQEELDVIHAADGRVKTFFDADLKRALYEGDTWKNCCDRIISQLPALVYVSFDIDGLDPKLCPNTGTPVAGGLEFEQAVYLLLKLVRSGRRIIGFDLNEVVPGETEWDANVGARMLYKLCNLMGLSQRMFDDNVQQADSQSVNEAVLRRPSLNEIAEGQEGIVD
ncbi:MAG: agmatinase family protein [Chitinophagales bacterium]|nr:agmatinase family protein [Chitinophagales bacterium]